mgnify:CR=1 FL=1
MALCTVTVGLESRRRNRRGEGEGEEEGGIAVDSYAARCSVERMGACVGAVLSTDAGEWQRRCEWREWGAL